MDKDQCSLLAGEDTEHLFLGTFKECLSNLWRVNGTKRDSVSGLGAWIITRGCDNETLAVGRFDEDCYY